MALSTKEQRLQEELQRKARAFSALSMVEKYKLIQSATPEEVVQLNYLWEAWAREKQLPPPGTDWNTWLILGGRGAGKTKAGAEFIRAKAESGKVPLMLLVGRTEDEARAVMVEGKESGLLSISHPGFMPKWEPTKHLLTWPNGAVANVLGASEPDSLRGYQSYYLWADELCAWRYGVDAWDNATFGLRLGSAPQAVVTTTPKPVKVLRALMNDQHTRITRMTSYENAANLAPSFFTQIVARYEGTRLGRQELNAEVLEDVEGALWHRESMIEAHRVTRHPPLLRVVVAVDPAMTGKSSSADTGIIVAGIGEDKHGYVLDDLTVQGLPLEWGTNAVVGFRKYHADKIIGEQNNGGELVRQNIEIVDSTVAYEAVYASRGKYTRAEPISTLYEKGLIHHVGSFPELEDELCSWEPLSGMKSPDRLDALVWALSALFIDQMMTADEQIAAMKRRVELQRERETKITIVPTLRTGIIQTTRGKQLQLPPTRRPE